jgi:hypothetical protein
MSTERYEVVKFSGLRQDETQWRVDKMNADLPAEQREEVEFRCCSGDPFYKLTTGPAPRSW